MIVVTQGLGTSQIPLFGFGDNFTHADAAVVTPSRYTIDVFGVLTLSIEELPSRGTPVDGAWTEVGQDGVWTENVQYPQHGAYTKNDMFDLEAKPYRWGGTFSADSTGTGTFSTEGKPSGSFTTDGAGE